MCMIEKSITICLIFSNLSSQEATEVASSRSCTSDSPLRVCLSPHPCLWSLFTLTCCCQKQLPKNCFGENLSRCLIQ